MTAVAQFLLPFLRRKVALGALVVLISVVAMAVLAPVIATHDPYAIEPLDRLLETSPDHLFGTDNFGRDIFSRVVFGSRVAILVGGAVVIYAIVGGTVISLFSAQFPRVGLVLMRVVDVLMGFPALLLALVLVTILDRSAVNTVIAVGTVYLTTTVRVLYGVTLRIQAEPYIDAVRVAGAGRLRIMFRHILPNLVSPIMVQATFIFAFAQLQTAALDFLGVGIPPEIPSWGNMLSEARIYVTRAPWLLMFPGLAIILTVLSLNLVGDVLRDQLDPKFKGELSGCLR